MTDTTLDFFSDFADRYAQYRLSYPDVIYKTVLDFVTSHNTAWDAATGNGQVAQELCHVFDNVIATDLSESQLAHAVKHPGITYRHADVYHSGIPENSIDLTTVGQAAHWFDFSAFCTEAKRVCKPGGILAIWCYGMFESPEPIQPLVHHFYHEVIGPYWHPRRKLIDNGYKDLNAPFEELFYGHFTETIHRSVEDLAGYIGTWSAVNNYRNQEERDPVVNLVSEIENAMGSSTDIPCSTRYYLKVWKV